MNDLIESLKVAMLGTTDGGFIEPESDIPAGEMFRLAAEWVERNTANLSAATGEVEWGWARPDGRAPSAGGWPEDTARRAATQYGRKLLTRTVGPWAEVTPEAGDVERAREIFPGIFDALDALTIRREVQS